jgi:regulator of cell morphogenesis and NO signaling
VTIDEICNIDPGASKVLDKFQMSPLLGTQVEFEEACYRKGVGSEMLKKELLNTYRSDHPHYNISIWSPDQLVDSLHHKQHILVKQLVKKTETTLHQVIAQYGSSRTELIKIKVSFDKVKEGLEKHIYTEETILFPAIQNIANRGSGRTQEEIKSFRLQYPIEVMKAEHDYIFQCMLDIKTASRNFSVPKNTSQSFNDLYLQLQNLKSILKNILSIEDNILYPAALQLEKEVACFE